MFNGDLIRANYYITNSVKVKTVFFSMICFFLLYKQLCKAICLQAGLLPAVMGSFVDCENPLTKGVTTPLH